MLSASQDKYELQNDDEESDSEDGYFIRKLESSKLRSLINVINQDFDESNSQSDSSSNHSSDSTDDMNWLLETEGNTSGMCALNICKTQEPFE